MILEREEKIYILSNRNDWGSLESIEVRVNDIIVVQYGKNLNDTDTVIGRVLKIDEDYNIDKDIWEEGEKTDLVDYLILDTSKKYTSRKEKIRLKDIINIEKYEEEEEEVFF